MRYLLLAGTIFAAALVLTTPTLPVWGDRHTPHTHRPPLPLVSGEVVEQTFRPEHSPLDLVVLWIDRSLPLPPEGGLALEVAGEGQTRHAVAAFRDIPESGTMVFPLTPTLPLPPWSPATLRVRLTHSGQQVALRYQKAERYYPEGELRFGENKGDLAFQLRFQRPALGSRATQAGAAATLVVAGVITSFVLRQKKRSEDRERPARSDWLAATLLGLAATAVYGTSLLQPGFWVGAGDFSKDAAYLKTNADALRAGAWPVWSHLTCGGMAALGNPEGNTMSLGTLLGLILPPDRALLVLLSLEAGIGAAGAYLLGRTLGISRAGSVVAASLAVLGGSNAYRIVEGLTPVGGAVAFTPWVFLGLVHSLRGASGWWTLGSGTALAAMFLRGDVHVVIGVTCAVGLWCVLESLRRRSWKPLGVGIGVAAVSLLWGSIKILPYLEQPDLIGRDLKPYVALLSRDRLLDDVFLRLHDRSTTVTVLHGEYLETWGNFGAYVGALPLLLAGIGLIVPHPYRLPLAAAAGLTFLISEGFLFDVVLRHWGPLGSLLRIPTRVFSTFVLFLGLLAGIGLDRVAQVFPRRGRRVIISALVLFLAADLGRATQVIFSRNLEWNEAPIASVAPGPAHAPHANRTPADPTASRHPTKLLRAGFLLPKICGDQNNPPIFVKELTTVTPLANLNSETRPNLLVLSAPAGPADVFVQSRFTSSWETTHGALLERADGSLHLVLPAGPPQTVTLRYRSATARASQALFVLLLGTLGVMLTRSAWRRRAPRRTPPP